MVMLCVTYLEYHTGLNPSDAEVEKSAAWKQISYELVNTAMISRVANTLVAIAIYSASCSAVA